MRPYREALTRDPDSSLRLLNRRLQNAIPFEWHHHREFELTLTLNSRGQRFVGDHVGDYDDGDLVLLGPNLPHTWFSRGKITENDPHIALVAWFHPDWARQMMRGVVEFQRIAAMLDRAASGLRFPQEATRSARKRFKSLFSCLPTARLLTLLSVLDELSLSRAEPLSNAPPLRDSQEESRERIDRILTHVHANYSRTIGLTELAGIGALSVSGLHRLFLKHTGRTISEYVAHLRIGDACARLSGTSQPIGTIAQFVGYSSLANFNRQFRTMRRMTPREYRKLFLVPRRPGVVHTTHALDS
jgi:AraC-like DNA-binding protein